MTLREPLEPIDERMLKVWRTTALIGSLIWLVLSALAAAATWKFGWPWWIGAVLLAYGIAELWLSVKVILPIRLRSWRYEIREDEIALKRGILFIKRTLIPMVRVQHVDMKQGPVMRRHGLAAITFSTAAGGHEIPGLSLETADAVRNRIMELARLAHEDI
ncbi:MAG: hypothetical protein K0R57_1599 [Paenibacillaceae bacterium]|jgi:membrane protein YdbS with pleckstrin-like domain|nr:hypothetical protein [Paenibacillaceae bacterium]